MAVSVHGELVHGILLQVLQNLSAVRLLEKILSGSLDLDLCPVL